MQHHAEHGEHLFGESYTLSQTPFQGVAWKMQSPEPELVDGLEGTTAEEKESVYAVAMSGKLWWRKRKKIFGKISR